MLADSVVQNAVIPLKLRVYIKNKVSKLHSDDEDCRCNSGEPCWGLGTAFFEKDVEFHNKYSGGGRRRNAAIYLAQMRVSLQFFLLGAS